MQQSAENREWVEPKRLRNDCWLEPSKNIDGGTALTSTNATNRFCCFSLGKRGRCYWASVHASAEECSKLFPLSFPLIAPSPHRFWNKEGKKIAKMHERPTQKDRKTRKEERKRC